MADSPVQLKDGGISDVLAEGENSRSEPETKKMAEISNTESPVTDHVNRENGDLTENQEKQSKKEESPSVNSSDEQNCGKTSPKSFTGDLDLTDPDSVIQMLENVDLTEEDTEDLLQEAYNMNRKLKEMLRRQEADSSGSASKPKLKSRGKPNVDTKHVNGQGKPSSASSSNSNLQNDSSFGIRKVLPPINHGEKDTSVYAIKLRRAKTNITEMKTTSSDSSVLRTRSSTKPSSKDRESPTRRRKASGPKPQWNDRFNYS